MKLTEFLAELQKLPRESSILIFDHEIRAMMFIGQVYVESGKAFMFSTPLKSEYSTVKGLIKKINFLIAASGSDYEVASGDVFDQSTEVTLQKSDNVMLMYFGYDKAA